MDIIKNIQDSFQGKISVQQKRPGIFQLYLPIFHEDGDMIDLFISENEVGGYTLCDYGLTIQRLAYSYDIDTENKEAILQKIVSENKLNEVNGNLSLDTNEKTIFGDIMQITQAYAKIGSMRYFKREVIESLFYEMLDEFITEELKEYKPVKKIYPIPTRTDLVVDYQFTPNGHPIFLFGVKDANKAKLTTITCLTLQKENVNFRGWVVNDDFERLPKDDKLRLTNTCDKQFTSFDDFKSSAKLFLERERK